MDDWKRAIVRVWNGRPNKGGIYQGTAFFINSHYLLTAKHVVENIDFNNLYLQGGALFDVGLCQINLPELHPSLDIAILPLKRPVIDAPIIPFSELEQSDLLPEQNVHLVGFSTAEGGLEIPEVKISAYHGDFNLNVAHTPIAKGMSGGAVLRDNKLVGITRAKDDAHTYLIPLRAFFDFVKSYQSTNSYAPLLQSVSIAELTELKYLLSDVTIDEQKMITFFRDFSPASILPNNYSLINCLEFLAKKAHLRVDNAPLLAFLEYSDFKIAEQLTTKKRAELALWKQNVAQKLGLDLKIIQDKAIINQKQRQQTSPVILLKIEPNVVSDKLFKLCAWIYQNNRYEPQNIAKQDYNLQELEASLDDILGKIIRQLGLLANEVVIEVILPITLFHWNINRIKIKISPTVEKDLGSRYPIIIRSWDRIYHEDYNFVRTQWLNKWNQACSQLIKTKHIHCPNDNNFCCNILFDTLEQKALFVTTLFSLSAIKDIKRNQEIFSTILAAGLPFMLWSPQTELDNKEHQSLKNLLCKQPTQQWVLAIQQQKAQKSFWNDVLILWDNPKRLPPDTDYQLTTSD